MKGWAEVSSARELLRDLAPCGQELGSPRSQTEIAAEMRDIVQRSHILASREGGWELQNVEFEDER